MSDKLVHLGDDARPAYLTDDISSWLGQQGLGKATKIPPMTPQAPPSQNVAIDAQGWNDPFDMNLRSSAALLLASNQALPLRSNDTTLSANGLPPSDGTSIANAALNTTLEPGLTRPLPVPEPAAIACWLIALASASGWLARTRARFAHPTVR